MPPDTYNSGILTKTEQLLQECTAWLRLLNFLTDESYYLKTKLSEALDNTNKDILAQAEYFQGLIILRDEYIKEMASDAKMHEDRLKEIISKNIPTEEKCLKQQLKLRNEMAFLEKDFIKMTEEFYRIFL